jgi:hypothetical protein
MSTQKAEDVIRYGSQEELQSKHFLIAGLARNSTNTIKRDIWRLKAALRLFPNLYWYVVESDSDDGTQDELKALALKIPNFRFTSLGALREKMPLRTERLAFCRNKYLEELKHNRLYANIDYLVVADLDGINQLIEEQGILSCWNRDDWDVCTANQRGPYSDVWALRHEIWMPNDCLSQYKFFVQNKLSERKALFAALYSKMITIPQNSDWIEVDSAFGGFAIYRRKSLADARYVGLNDRGEEICEHVPFHAMLKSTACRIFINPKLINAGYTEHTKPLRLLSRLKQKVKWILYRLGLGSLVKAYEARQRPAC